MIAQDRIIFIPCGHDSNPLPSEHRRLLLPLPRNQDILRAGLCAVLRSLVVCVSCRTLAVCFEQSQHFRSRVASVLEHGLGLRLPVHGPAPAGVPVAPAAAVGASQVSAGLSAATAPAASAADAATSQTLPNRRYVQYIAVK